MQSPHLTDENQCSRIYLCSSSRGQEAGMLSSEPIKLWLGSNGNSLESRRRVSQIRHLSPSHLAACGAESSNRPARQRPRISGAGGLEQEPDRFDRRKRGKKKDRTKGQQQDLKGNADLKSPLQMMSGSSSWRGGGGGAGASGDSFSRKPSRVNFASQGVAALTPVKASIQADSSSPTKPVAGRPSPNMRTQATSDAAAAHSPLRPSRTLGNAAAAATTPLRDSVDALPHHGVSPSPLRALSLDLSQHHSRSVSSTLSASMSFDSMSSARSWQSLPSLSLSLQSKSTALSDLEFASTTPVFSRNRFDLFGMEGKERKPLCDRKACVFPCPSCLNGIPLTMSSIDRRPLYSEGFPHGGRGAPASTKSPAL